MNALSKRPGVCISIFMPTFRTGTESQQNQIRLRNLLRQAEEKLLARGLRTQEIKELLEPAQSLPGNILFWKRQGDGLALFLTRGLFRTFCLPAAFDERLTVADRFHIQPLLPLLSGDRRFYILALSQKEVRLYEGTEQELRPIELESLPKGLAEALQVDVMEKQVRFRAGAAGGGAGAAMISGHGAVADDTKDNLLRYFRLIDRGLHDLLKDERTPLILTGVEYLFPIYREVNTYPHLIAEGIPGNPKGSSPDALHRTALQIVRPFFSRAETEAIAQYHQSSGTGLASADLREIVPAASHGRVGLLLIASGRQEWGSFDRSSGSVEPSRDKEAGNEDLLEIAALDTYLNGGAVFLLPPERMPAAGSLVAVFRY
jgi:hypothetical protein